MLTLRGGLLDGRQRITEAVAGGDKGDKQGVRAETGTEVYSSVGYTQGAGGHHDSGSGGR